MPHKHKKKNKLFRMAITQQQALPSNVLQFTGGSDSFAKNEVKGMGEMDRNELEELIIRRYRSAEDVTNAASKEIEKAEREFWGVFPDKQMGEDLDPDDSRIYMKKSLEQMQSVYSHLDSLTGQLNPLLVFQPKPSGINPPAEEFSRAKVKEILTNNYLRDNKFKKEILPRWRWNFLKHPSAYLRVIYDSDAMAPDIKIDVIDRGALYIDPLIDTGNIRDAAWVIQLDWVTEDEAYSLVEEGHWHIPGGLETVSNFFAPPQDPLAARITGQWADTAHHMGPDKDRLVEVWHYWQAEKRGQDHAYGVLLGGKQGRLVRWGPNPMPYKGIPYRGKSYIRDTYKPDGMSLAQQYRSIQEVYNTFLNLRIEDVLEGVKRQMLVVESLFDDKTKEDLANDQRFVRANKDFVDQILQEGKRLEDFMTNLSSGDSTQHLLKDLEYLNVEGREQTHTNDAFRGQNPQAGATLGQYQEQLHRALGAFKPVFSQEMTLVEEIGEIINVYFEDEDFFGPERLVSILGPNRYTETVQGFNTDPLTNTSLRNVTFDEMDVDVTVDVISQAEHLASKTLRAASFNQFLDGLRHHPKLVEAASKVVNFNAYILGTLQDSGQDIEAITYTDKEQQERAQQEKQQKNEDIQQQLQIMGATAKVQEGAKGERELTVAQTKIGLETKRDQLKISAEHEAGLETLVAKTSAGLRAEMETINAEHKFEMNKMLQDHLLQLVRMNKEQVLEIEAAKQGVKASIQSGGDDINTNLS